MMFINISVLLGLPLVSQEIVRKNIKKSKKVTEQKTSDDRGSNANKIVVNVGTVDSSNTPNYSIKVENALVYAHVEYELLPGLPPYKIDVKCWGPVAKVKIFLHKIIG